MTTQVTPTRDTEATQPKERYLLVSSDCHASPPNAVYREYLDPGYRKQYDDWVASFQLVPALATVGVVGQGRRDVIAAFEAVKSGGGMGAYDPAIRVRELDREGIAAEIIFADSNQPISRRPFRHGDERSGEKFTAGQYWAGARAHNRWLAGLCAHQPDRHAGVAVLLKDDPQLMIEEATWAKKASLTGGVAVPNLPLTADRPEDFWHHPRYEAFWSACEEMDVPVHTHSGGPFPDYGDTPGGRWILTSELRWTGFRLVTMLLWGGVLERHPKLKIVITECGGGYVPYMLSLFDDFSRDRNPEALSKILKHKPSEYWARQCYVGSSPPGGRYEVENRHALGVRNIMWGSDYPHAEGTWPESDRRLREAFEGVPEDEVRLMAGENAVKVYGLDIAKLRLIGDRIGPKVGSFHEPRSAR